VEEFFGITVVGLASVGDPQFEQRVRHLGAVRAAVVLEDRQRTP
jgi:hypothetical protein